MYKIDRERNQCYEINKVTFSELGFKEREHLQEWFAKDPSMFGEDLLIIQKEFDGFAETRERLDLLALDKLGNLVIIENKLDDSGRDVTWQVLKYASYCSSLTKENIRGLYQEYLDKSRMDEDAETNISEFLNQDYDEIILNQGTSQRIILVAANFRKEVTSTVVWLMNNNIDIKCIKVTPFKVDDALVLDVDQIIPMEDIKEYTISMIDKQVEEKSIHTRNQSRHLVRLKFWELLLNEMNEKTEFFSKISPKKDNWLAAGSGISGVIYSFVISKRTTRVELYIDTGNKTNNKKIFDYFYESKLPIEGQLSSYVVAWNKMEDKNASRISIPIDFNYFEQEKWDVMIPSMIAAMMALHNALSPFIRKFEEV